jgi:hypothetical protein
MYATVHCRFDLNKKIKIRRKRAKLYDGIPYAVVISQSVSEKRCATMSLSLSL